MNPSDYIISRQVEWARNRGLELIGSQGQKGRKVYTTSLDHNLLQPLHEQTRQNISNGDGGELNGNEARPAKMQALHSSSALGINVFDYWKVAEDLAPITASCGLSRFGSRLSGDVRFEQQFQIDKRFRYAPNLDVAIYPNTSKYKVFAIECKFTEAYNSIRTWGQVKN